MLRGGGGNFYPHAARRIFFAPLQNYFAPSQIIDMYKYRRYFKNLDFSFFSFVFPFSSLFIFFPFLFPSFKTYGGNCPQNLGAYAPPPFSLRPCMHSTKLPHNYPTFLQSTPIKVAHIIIDLNNKDDLRSGGIFILLCILSSHKDSFWSLELYTNTRGQTRSSIQIQGADQDEYSPTA